MKEDDLKVIEPQVTNPHSDEILREALKRRNQYQKIGEKRKVKQDFSCANKDWLKRNDLVEVTGGVTKTVYFSAVMAKKYAVIYMFALYFGKGRVWGDRVLELLGWDHKRLKQQYTMILYRLVRTLRQDFNIVITVNSVKKTSPEYEGHGTKYYEIADYGLFSKPKLLSMLKANANVFINIVENGLGTNSFIYTSAAVEDRNIYKHNKDNNNETNEKAHKEADKKQI